jgi:hypothetical protein
MLAFKLLKAGEPTTPSGFYSYWWDLYALNVGQNNAAPAGAASFTSRSDCAVACDADPTCAGFTLQNLVNATEAAQSCQLVRGGEDLDGGRRSFVRANATNLEYTRFEGGPP